MKADSGLNHRLANAPINAALPGRNDWLERICLAVQHGDPIQRLIAELDWLDSNPEAKARTARLIRGILRDSSALKLFSDTGIPSEQGFLGEVIERFLAWTVPQPVNDRDLAHLLPRLFPHEKDEAWLTRLPGGTWERLTAWVGYGLAEGEPTPGQLLRKDLLDSLLLLSSYLCSIGLSELIRARVPARDVRESPFLGLHRACELVVGGDLQASSSCQAEIARCRGDVREVFAHLEESGLTIGLVYQLEKIEAHLGRIESILQLIAPRDSAGQPVARRPDLEGSFMAALISGARHDRSFSFVLRNNLRRISRKVVERSGDAGEHYIARNRSEYFAMVRSAAGGGVFTAGTTLVKYGLSAIKFPLFFQAFFNSVNYAGSFVLMQAFGFTLATKQPSMTAAALAGRLRETRNMHEFESFVELVARITRSQFAAALGNLGAVIPTAWLISWICQRFFGHVIFDAETAQHIVESLDPLTTLTLPYAALTGALLWGSSACASWIENWTVYRRVPEALLRSRKLQRWIGEQGAKRTSEIFSHQVLSTASSITLGILLAVVPMAGKFSGLPLDVRHVTLSTGALTFAIAGPSDLSNHSILMAAAGIALIGVLNFGVSFAISLFFAVRARGVNREWMRLFFRTVIGHFVRRPLEFFLPLKD